MLGWGILIKAGPAKDQKFFRHYQTRSVFHHQVSVLCKKGQAWVRCHQCRLEEVMCLKCDEEKRSRNTFHDRDIYHEGFFKPVTSSVSLDSDGHLMSVCQCSFKHTHHQQPLSCVLLEIHKSDWLSHRYLFPVI